MTTKTQGNTTLLIGLTVVLAVSMALSLTLGPVQLSMESLLAGLFGGLFGGLGTDGSNAANEAADLIVREIRLPRTLLAAFVGASLALAGAAMQGLLRNPLASPGLTGSMSGASLGCVLALYTGLAASGSLIMPITGTVGALLALLAVQLLAFRDARPTTLILAGVAINAIALAAISLVLSFAPSPFAVNEIVLWTLGSVANRSWDDLLMMLGPCLLGWLLLTRIGRALDALTLGEETATSLGVNLARIRRRLLLGVALAVGASVSVSGSVGFVGLVVPHLLRPLVGYQPSRLLWPSALGGAILVVLADCLVRSMPPGPELKLGVLTSLLGTPLFLYLILKMRRQEG